MNYCLKSCLQYIFYIEVEKLNQLYYNISLSTIYERGHDNEKQDRKIVSKYSNKKSVGI